MALCAALLALQLPGCASLTGEVAEEVAQEAAEPATADIVDELDSPRTRRQINNLSRLPAFENIGELFALGMARGLSEFIGAEVVGPEAEPMARTADRFERFSVRVARRATTAVLQAFADAVPDRLGPALRALMTDYLGPALAEVMREQVGPAVSDAVDREAVNDFLADSAQTVGRHAVLGIERGAREAQRHSPRGGGPIEGLNRALAQGEQTMETLLWMLGASVLVLLVMVLVLGGGLWRAVVKSRGLLEENRVREEALTDMAHAVQAAEEAHGGEDAAILDRIKREIEKREGGDYLRDVLRRAEGSSPDER